GCAWNLRAATSWHGGAPSTSCRTWAAQASKSSSAAPPTGPLSPSPVYLPPALAVMSVAQVLEDQTRDRDDRATGPPGTWLTVPECRNKEGRGRGKCAAPQHAAAGDPVPGNSPWDGFLLRDELDIADATLGETPRQRAGPREGRGRGRL